MMEMNLSQEFTDKTKMIQWLTTAKGLILRSHWSPMKDSKNEDKMYSITGQLTSLIEKHVKEIGRQLK